MQNQQAIDYVTKRLQDKNGGAIPSKKEVDAEMEKRWQFKEQGINDNKVIDGAIDLLDEKENATKEAMSKDQAYSGVEKALEDKQYAKDYKKLMDANKSGRQDKIDEQRKEFDKKYAEQGGAAAAESHNAKKGENEKRNMTQATVAARIASEYSTSDFRDEKKMTSLQKSMSKEYSQNTGSSDEHSRKVVNRAIMDASKIKGVNKPNIS